jgi:hypothetical protein
MTLRYRRVPVTRIGGEIDSPRSFAARANGRRGGVRSGASLEEDPIADNRVDHQAIAGRSLEGSLQLPPAWQVMQSSQEERVGHAAVGEVLIRIYTDDAETGTPGARVVR